VKLLTPLAEAENGDGRAFKAKAGNAKFFVYAESNALDKTPDALATEATKECPSGQADYRIAKPTLVAVSCATATEILYQKTIIHDGMLTSIAARYAKSERATWDPVVAKMANSLTLDQPGVQKPVVRSAHAADQDFTDCLLSKAKEGQYSSFDGGKSAMRLLGECPKQWKAYVDACMSMEDAEGDCTLKSGLLAQSALKLLNK
jgi:hypothetical protein